MGKTTEISWCDSTLNLQMGCDGCELWNPAAGVRHCYAGELTERYGGSNKGFPLTFDQPKIFAERLKPALKWPDLTGKERPDKPWLNGRPRMIFLNDMGDTFTESLPLDWLVPFLPQMADSPHQFMLLTKRASRLWRFSQDYVLPPNVWPGVSITSQKTARRAFDLCWVIGGGPKWLSVEPLLSTVDLRLVGEGRNTITPLKYMKLVIVGGESGHNARPCCLEYVDDLRRQCEAAAVPCFVKQLGSFPVTTNCNLWDFDTAQLSAWGDCAASARINLRDSKGGDINEFPDSLRVRQFPSVGAMSQIG